MVAFLPAASCSERVASRIGELQDFHVVSMNRTRKNVVVNDATMQQELQQGYNMGQQRMSKFRKQQQQRPSMLPRRLQPQRQAASEGQGAPAAI